MSASLPDDTPPKPKNKGGRPLGSKNRTTIIKSQIVRAALANQRKLPLQIFMDVMNGDTSITPLQLQAAALAAPYVHPKLIAMKVASVDPLKAQQDEAATLLGLDSADPIEAARLYAQYMNPAPTGVGTPLLEGYAEQPEDEEG